MKNKGFTLIELLVVVAIIGVLASVVMSSLSEARDKARYAAMLSEINQIEKMMVAATVNQNQLLWQVTGSTCTDCMNSCRISPDLSACIPRWELSITRIVEAAGEDPSVAEVYFTDPWGNPYLLDENHMAGNCSSDRISSSLGVDHFDLGYSRRLEVLLTC